LNVKVGDLVEIDSIQHGLKLAIVLDSMGDETISLEGFYEVRLIKSGNHIAVGREEVTRIVVSGGK